MSLLAKALDLRVTLQSATLRYIAKKKLQTLKNRNFDVHYSVTRRTFSIKLQNLYVLNCKPPKRE